MKNILLAIGLSALAGPCIAEPSILVPQSASCINSAFSVSGTSWKNISLKITNACGQDVDFQNSTITFLNKNPINTNFWGSFSPLSYPLNSSITSQKSTGSNYLASIPLQFPTEPWALTKLPKGKSFTVNYSQAGADYIENSVQVYLNSTPSGSIHLINTTAKPANVSQAYVSVAVTLNGQPVTLVQVPWSGQQSVSGLSAGTYSLSPVNVNDSQGTVYQGIANPSTVMVANNTPVSSSITYTATRTDGSIILFLQALPEALAGYSGQPSVTLTKMSNGSSAMYSLNWNKATILNSLVNGSVYSFATQPITYNGYNCLPAFSPATTTAAQTAPTVNLSYTCTQVVQSNVTVNIQGAPLTKSSLAVSFTPNFGSGVITQNIPLNNGSGTQQVELSNGVIYTVNAEAINGYKASYAPQPLTATANAVETISYSKASGGRVIAYIPGWKPPPAAAAVAKAGYTHVLIAFGVFSTTTPGQVVASAFDTINPAYIQDLHNAGIKVLLSLGGASSSIPNTTVNFHQVLSAAPSSSNFVQQFIQSLENLRTQYGFDGFDIDIEHGLTAGGTFSNPTGDIAVMATILNTLKSKHPELMLSLTPQLANIAATSGFDETWGNYASLVMQTYQSLEWVGIQVYNAGCIYGIDMVCYDPNNNSSPNTSVAIATDLLENWPATTNSGQKTGFQPYISYLKPSQVVLGYPAADNSGISDGLPAANTTTIKRAIQCLRTGLASTNSCDTYIPPRVYPEIGGVFEWEINYDAANNYAFATQMTNCVVFGNCE